MQRKVIYVLPMAGGEYRYTLSCGHKQTGRESTPKRVNCKQCGGSRA